ncbi:hypothetical protein [Neisseria sp. HMSC068C12]|nr:hypothetical protein [Neisseria sp. HMSC068C12]
MLKLNIKAVSAEDMMQPPSGGCVLKQELAEKVEKLENSRLRAAVC